LAKSCNPNAIDKIQKPLILYVPPQIVAAYFSDLQSIISTMLLELLIVELEAVLRKIEYSVEKLGSVKV
jgi:hypothetical protein